jgi:hypothetical protein
MAPVGRPTGEIRQALAKAATRLANEKGAGTWRDLAVVAQVGFDAARQTVENMERAGDLEVVGSEKREHSRRWMKLYAPPQSGNFATSTTGDSLAAVLKSWPRG